MKMNATINQKQDKIKVMADEEEVQVDIAGQPGGPSLETQALVDEEQRRLIERIKAERAPAEAEAARLLNEKIERAIAAQAERKSFEERLKLLEARVLILGAR